MRGLHPNSRGYPPDDASPSIWRIRCHKVELWGVWWFMQTKWHETHLTMLVHRKKGIREKGNGHCWTWQDQDLVCWSNLFLDRRLFIVAHSFNQVTIIVQYEPPPVGLVEKVDISSLQLWDAKHISFTLKLLETKLKIKLMNAIHRVTC